MDLRPHESLMVHRPCSRRNSTSGAAVLEVGLRSVEARCRGAGTALRGSESTVAAADPIKLRESATSSLWKLRIAWNRGQDAHLSSQATESANPSLFCQTVLVAALWFDCNHTVV